MSWVVRSRRRASALALAAAIALAFTGAVGLVFQPQPVSAGVTPGIAPSFEVGPGDVAPETFNQTLIGSAEARSNPDDCRNNPALGLTCAAHRIKVHRTTEKDYQLRVILEWDAQAADTLSVPDVDMFLFDGPTTKFESTEIGGAGQTMPEQLQIVPTQDEYDLVVQAWAGAITSYKLTVSYTKNATIKAGEITPDIVLTPHKPPFIHEYDTVLIGQTGLAVYPEGCRGQYDYVCDVYRVKLNRNLSKAATNFVVLTLSWEPSATVPGINTPAIGLVEHPLPDLDIYVYDAPEHSLDGIGGQHIENVPERSGWVATQDEYDVVIQSSAGQALNYKITAFMSDEIFDKPFELLDPVTGEVLRQEPDGTLVPISAPSEVVEVPPLALAPIDVDDAIAGIGLGATEQFDPEQSLRIAQDALRNTAATSSPPSAAVLWLTLVLVPFALLALGVVMMRRRHNEAF